MFGWEQRGGSGWALPPSVGKLYTLQPFSWPGSLDKVRIVCQQAVMPGMLSAGSPCVWVSLTLYFASPAVVWICSTTPKLPELKSFKRLFFSPAGYFGTPTPPSHCPSRDCPVCTLHWHFVQCSIRPSWHHFLNEQTHEHEHTHTRWSGDSQPESYQCPAASESCSTFRSNLLFGPSIEINDVSSHLIISLFIYRLHFVYLGMLLKLLLMALLGVNTWFITALPVIILKQKLNICVLPGEDIFCLFFWELDEYWYHLHVCEQHIQ